MLTWGILLNCLLSLVVVMLACVHVGLLWRGRSQAATVLFCSGLLGMQVVALIARALSSADDIRATLAALQRTGFVPTGSAQLVLGVALGFQPLSQPRRVCVAAAELSLFGLNILLTYARTGEEALLRVWVPCHISSFVLGLHLAMLARGELGGDAATAAPSAEAAGRDRGDGAGGMAPCKDAQSGRRADALLVLLTALMFLPLAQWVVAMEERTAAPFYVLSALV